MIKIRKLTEIPKKLSKNDLPNEVIEDILYQTYIFETEFKQSKINEIILLKKFEDYNLNGLLPELEFDIEGFHKSVYIVCDSGEGIIIYKEINSNE